MNSSTERHADSQKQSEFQQDLDFLRQVPLFQGLDYECLKLMAMLSKRIDLIEGDQLMVQGEDDGSCCYIISGSLKSFHNRNGTDSAVQTYEPGQFLGGLALLGKTIRLFTVQAMTESTILRLNRDSFQKVMQQFPGSMTKISANLAAELTGWERNRLKQAGDETLESGNRLSGISLL